MAEACIGTIKNTAACDVHSNECDSRLFAFRVRRSYLELLEENSFVVYRPIHRDEISDAVAHLRDLHRQLRPSNDRERYAFERRELVTKNLLSNLRRTGEHPTLSMLLEVGDIFSLTIEGAHRLFGYDLGRIREYDLRLNGRRTHIVESYAFERDLLVDLPLDLASSEAFASNGTLRELVRNWQRDVPMRALRGPAWRRPGTFYVHVGTEDSLGSSLPPGSMGLVEPVEEEEARQPNPRSMYLLQFGNGYRFSPLRCVHGYLTSTGQ